MNIDYESVLYSGKPNPEFNRSLEFLPLFLEPKPLFSTRDYPQSYLTYISDLTGKAPQFTSSGPTINWWGELKDLERERFLNSKITSTELAIKKGWNKQAFVLKSRKDLDQFSSLSLPIIMKSPHEMSGRGFKVFQDLSEVKTSSLNPGPFPFILEPLLTRQFDFSAYHFSDGHLIYYQNLVDEKFQYKGTIFKDWRNPDLAHLTIFDSVGTEQWARFEKAMEELRGFYLEHSRGLRQSFSVDSFLYKEDGTLKIHYVSEVNFRKTMGSVTYELARKFSRDRPWAMLLLMNSKKIAADFKLMKEKLSSILTSGEKSGVIILSPGDVRFEMFFLTALDSGEGEQLQRELLDLLSHP